METCNYAVHENGSGVMETQIRGGNGSGCSGCDGNTNTQWKWVRCDGDKYVAEMGLM